MALDDTLTNQELLTLARERQGFFKGKQGFYIGTQDRGDDSLLLSDRTSQFRGELLQLARFGIYELGFEGMYLLDLAQIQMRDIIAGPFETHSRAVEVLPYVLRVRYQEG